MHIGDTENSGKASWQVCDCGTYGIEQSDLELTVGAEKSEIHLFKHPKASLSGFCEGCITPLYISSSARHIANHLPCVGF